MTSPSTSNSNTPTPTSPSPSMQYSKALSEDPPQSKHNALVLQMVKGIDFKDYLLAMKQVVDLKQITDAYPWNQGRIIVFVKNRQLADSIAEKHSCIIVKGCEVTLRKFILPDRRIVFMTMGQVPNSLIEKKMVDLEIPLSSSVTKVKLTCDKELGHINSGKRQAYVSPEVLPMVPESIVVNFEEEEHKITIITEHTKCSSCGKRGHFKGKCPDSYGHNSSSAKTTRQGQAVNNAEIKDIQSREDKKDQNSNIEKTNERRRNLTAKRTLNSRSSSAHSFHSVNNELEQSSEVEEDVNTKKPKHNESSLDGNDFSLCVSQALDDGIEYPLSDKVFSEILKTCANSQDILADVRAITSDCNGLKEMIVEVKPRITNKLYKNKLRNIIRKINNGMAKDENDEDCYVSSDSECELTPSSM